MQVTRQWEYEASPLLSSASASLDTCAAQLRAQSAAQRAASTAHGSLGTTRALPPAPPGGPPRRGSPADNAFWWRSLSTLQQQRVIREQPDWIGNRDGVSFTDRDAANRALLKVDHNRLEAERRRLEAALAGDWSRGAFTNDDTALDQVDDKLASLAVITACLASPGQTPTAPARPDSTTRAGGHRQRQRRDRRQRGGIRSRHEQQCHRHHECLRHRDETYAAKSAAREHQGPPDRGLDDGDGHLGRLPDSRVGARPRDPLQVGAGRRGRADRSRQPGALPPGDRCLS